MELVDENTVLEVGKFYNVKCAAMGDSYNSFRYYLPIIGEAHIDKQFGFDDKHYHIDGRFLSNKNIHVNFEDGFTNSVCSIGESIKCIYTVQEIVVKKLKCKRLVTGLYIKPRGELRVNGEQKYKEFWDWYDTMVGKICKGKRCPHLGTKMFEQDGHLICPLHNLKGSLQTEKIIY